MDKDIFTAKDERYYIVYGSGSADEAMASFPPDDTVLQDSFMAVCTGPESHAQNMPLKRPSEWRAKCMEFF